VASSRAVRIPRAGPPGGTAPESAAPPSGPPTEPSTRRVNRAGAQRAVRLTGIYLVCLAALYAGFVLLQRTTPGGTSSGAGNGLDAFTVLAVILAVGGAVVSLHPAARYVETSATSTVVVGRWGRRHTYPPIGQLSTREIRRYPAGILSNVPVVSVEIAGGPSGRATFLLEEGLVPADRPGR